MTVALFALGIGWQWFATVQDGRDKNEQQPSCEPRTGKPSDCEHQAVRAAIRAANATEDTVDVATFGLALSFAGLLGVGFTVLYARGAWRAAERSADAADKTLRATREGEERQLRAYVHVSEASYRRDLGGTQVEVKFKNFGLTPAHDVWIERRASVRDYPLTEPLAPVERDRGLFDLPPNGDGNTMVFPFAEWDDPSPSRFGSGGTALYLHGTIHYKDAFRKDRETHFRLFRRSHSDSGIAPDDEGNWVT